MNDFYTEHEKTAAKEHTCEEAGVRGCVRTGTIRKGQRYVRCFGAYDGYAYSAKLCMRCKRAYQRAHERFGPFLHDGDGPSFGDLVSWLRDAHRGDHGETRKERAKREERYQRLVREDARRVRLLEELRAAAVASRSGP